MIFLYGGILGVYFSARQMICRRVRPLVHLHQSRARGGNHSKSFVMSANNTNTSIGYWHVYTTKTRPKLGNVWLSTTKCFHTAHTITTTPRVHCDIPMPTPQARRKFVQTFSNKHDGRWADTKASKIVANVSQFKWITYNAVLWQAVSTLPGVSRY